jgi:exodeoxyribonuclease (lambda-induced)
MEQRSEEWFNARLGIPTTSGFGEIVTVTGARTSGDKRKVYMMKLVCEEMLGERMGDDISNMKWPAHGIKYENQAAYTLAQMAGLELAEGQFFKRLGCGSSPDRLVVSGGNYRGKGGVEIKCPAPWTHMQTLLYGPNDKYLIQTQGQMLICELDYVHFFSFHPQMPSYHAVFLPQPTFQSKLAKELKEFVKELEVAKIEARSKGEYRRSNSS